MSDSFIRPIGAITPKAAGDPRERGAERSTGADAAGHDHASRGASQGAESIPSAVDHGRHRLIIESAGDHRFVYKILDRVTGEVIRQFPREELLKRRDDPHYSPGDMFEIDV